jgi:hypothetical protein
MVNSQGHALINHVVESAHGLLHRGKTVGSVGVHDINIFQIQTLQRSLETFDDVLAGQTMVVNQDLAIAGSPVNLSTRSALRGP